MVLIHSFHGHAFSDYFSGWQTNLMLIERWLARQSSAVIAISNEAKENLVRLAIVPAEKATEISTTSSRPRRTRSNSEIGWSGAGSQGCMRCRPQRRRRADFLQRKGPR